MDKEHIILVVEDSDEDFEATKRAFKKSGLANVLIRCRDGEEAIDYFFSEKNSLNFIPNIILLDLNLPGTDGLEVLKKLKGDDRFKRIPIVVLTTSSDEYDIEKCHDSGVNSYMVKPVNLGKFIEAIQHLNDYWFEVVVLPKG